MNELSCVTRSNVATGDRIEEGYYAGSIVGKGNNRVSLRADRLLGAVYPRIKGSKLVGLIALPREGKWWTVPPQRHNLYASRLVVEISRHHWGVAHLLIRSSTTVGSASSAMEAWTASLTLSFATQ